jgi:uncharacterized protein (TIGR00730 family)
MLKNICVFCASSSQISEDYLKDAADLGKIFAKNKITVTYGGGSVGAMGAIADSVLESKGTIIGVIPRFMLELEWGNNNVTELIVVESMADRKKMMLKDVDAVVVLPGGTGTLEELAETMSLKKLGLFVKPIILLNTNNFFDPLLSFFDQMIKANFLHAEHRNIFSVALKPEDVIEKIKNSPKWDQKKIKLAAL